MDRREAIEILARDDVTRLSRAEREALLLDWWTIDSSDPDYEGLTDLLRAELRRREEPRDPMISLYDPLLLLALRRSLVGVVNSYLEHRLRALGRHEVVVGDVEVLEACPCCQYRSLSERGAFSVCRVCFWEDDGTTELDRISGANRLTLRAARANFAQFGAVDQRARSRVLPDGTLRYALDG